MVRMNSSYEDSCTTVLLTQGIDKMPSGVFWWVMVVVRSLLEILRNSDSKHDDYPDLEPYLQFSGLYACIC